MQKKTVNANIWKEVHHLDESPEMEIKIFKHSENCGNNGDKHLVVLTAESQNFLIGKCYNDERYELPRLKETETLSFVVVGNIEIGSIIRCFKSFKRKHE